MSNGAACPHDPTASASTVIRVSIVPVTAAALAEPACRRSLFAIQPPSPPVHRPSLQRSRPVLRTNIASSSSSGRRMWRARPTNQRRSVPSDTGATLAFSLLCEADHRPKDSPAPNLARCPSLFIAGLAYLVFSTCYNRFVLGYRGWDQLPQLPWPSLQLPNIRSLFRREPRSGPSWGSWRRGGYGQVGAVDPDDDEDQHLAGRFSLDDDEEGDQDARALAGDPSVWRDARPANASSQQRKGSDPLLHL